MTSNPASRSAAATTFAPRSWPSRPAFATRTRMGRLRAARLQLDGGGEVGGERLGPVAVGLVDDEEVGRLDEPALHRLDGVPRPRREHYHCGIGRRGDGDLGLADADGL